MTAIFEIFYQPGKVFESLPERKHAWIPAIVLDMAILIAITAVTLHFIGMETILRQRLEGTRLTPEQMQTALERAASPTQVYISYAGAAFSGILAVLAIAGLLTVFAMMSSRQPRFTTMLSMVALAFLPYWLITGVMTSLVMLVSPDPGSLDVSNILATNAAAFLDRATTSKWLYSVAGSIDLLSFFEIGFLSLRIFESDALWFRFRIVRGNQPVDSLRLRQNRAEHAVLTEICSATGRGNI